jgi:ABC-2 type transport system ATP-binding protein
VSGSTQPPAGSAEAVLEVGDVRKRYGEREALRGVSFAAGRGELLAILGPNGAGKTTLLSIIAGFLPPDAGGVSRTPAEIGWVPQQAALYRRLTVEENLRLFAKLEEVDDVEATVDELLDRVDLADRRGDQVATLSGGNQQRVNIAIGLLGKPPVLLLDEPSSGLDPRSREQLWGFLTSLAAEGTTVIFSTHNIGEAERYGQRLLVIADGEVLFYGTVAELHDAEPTPEGASTERDFERAFIDFLSARGH